MMKPWKKFMSLVLASSMIITLPAVTSAAEFEATVYDVSDDSGSEAIENENTDTDAASFSGNDDAASQNQTLDFGDGQFDSEETDFSSGDQEFVADESEFADAAGAISMGTKPADGITENQPFISNTTGGSANFRIPAMVTLSDGTIVAATDARWNTTSDGFGLDTVVSRSNDGGATWNYTFANYLGDNGNTSTYSSTAFIDPALAVDSHDTIYMLVDLYPAGGWIRNLSAGSGYDDSGRLKLTTEINPSDKSTYDYYLYEGKIYENNGNPVSDLTVDGYFNVKGNYEGKPIDTNLFFADSPFKVLKTSYLYLTKSTDGGKSWSEPTMLNSQVKKSGEKFFGVGPGRGLVVKNDNGTERIIFPCYTNDNGTDGSTAVIYSDDNGTTWKRAYVTSVQTSEATLTEANGNIYMFTRYGGYFVSTDNGESWSEQKSVSGISYTKSCQMNAITYSKKIDGKTAILLSAATNGRNNGKIFVGLVQDDGSIQWNEKYAYAVNTGVFQYSCMTELNDGSVALLYENGTASEYFVKYSMNTIIGKEGSTLTDKETGVKVDFIKENVQSMTVNPASVEKLNDKKYVAYDVLPDTADYHETPATVTVPLGDNLANAKELQAFYVTEGNVESVDGTKSDNSFVFNVPHFTVVGVVDATSDATPPDNTIPDNGTKETVNVSLRIGQTVDYIQERTNAGNYSNAYVNAVAKDSGEYYKGATFGEGTFGVSSSADSKSSKTQLTFKTAVGDNQYYVTNENNKYVYPYAKEYYIGWQYSLKTSTEPVAVTVAQQSDGSIVISRNYSAWFGSTTAYLSVSGSNLKESKVSSNIYLYDKKPGTSVTLTGLKAGTTSVVIGNTTYNITVTAVQEATVENGPFVSKQGQENGKYVTKLTISKGKSYSLGVNATGNVKWSTENENIATVDQSGNVTGVSEGVTVLYATIDGVTYSMPIVVSGYTGNSKVFDLYINDIVDTTAYYGVLYGSSTGNVQASELVKVTQGEVIYLVFNNSSSAAVDFFASPKVGYALTRMKATKSFGHYMALNGNDPAQTHFLKRPGAAGANQLARDFDSNGVAVKNLVQSAMNQTPKCDGGLGFTRKPNEKDTVSSILDFYSEKLPTVEKKIESITRNGKKIAYKEGMVARVGDTINFAITVKKYECTDKVTYTDARLTERLSNAFFDGNATVKNIQISGGTEEKSTTYYVTYKIEKTDLDTTITNVVDLDYTYQSEYSTGDFGGTAQAEAKIVASNFPGIDDLVIDFGLPVNVTVNNWESAAGDKVKVTGKAKYGDVSITGDNRSPGGMTVTYTPNTILKDVDTVTLTATAENGTGTPVPYSFKVYPATTVYYEEGFAKYIGKWDKNGTGSIIEQDLSVAGAGNAHYGYDTHYAGESYGPSNHTQATSSKIGDSASFDFTGTGIDIYANGSSGSDIAAILILKDNDKNQVVKLAYVDTKTGTGTTDATNNQNQDSYNQPIVSLTGLAYGNYTVTIKHSAMNNKENPGSLNLDGFRVYGTLADEKDNPVYTKDLEENPSYVELRDKVLKALNLTPGDAKNQVHAAISGEAEGATTAIVLKKGDKKVDKKDDKYVDDLKNNGPKNEIYLRKNEALEFKLTTDKIAQIGLKALTGATHYTLRINDDLQEKYITSSTDMFYKLCDATENTNREITVVITNNGGNTGKEILAITKLKICDDPSAALTALSEKDLEVALDDLGLSEKEDSTPTPTESPKPSEAPVPTESPKPSEAPVPTETPKPTESPKPSETPEATPTPTKEPEKPVKLSTPKLGKVVSVSYNSVKVTWNKVKDADGYRVYMKQNGKWKSLGKVDSNSYTCKGLKTGKKYTFTVRAYKNTKDGVVLSAYDKKGISGTPKLSTPVLKSAKRSASGVTFTWKKTAGANGYVVYRKANNGAWRAAAKVTKGTTYKDTTAKKGVKYTYTVRALRKSGATSVYSDYNAKGISVK